ncbi:hypothetical protein A2U01_0046441, partial [Trifolium medium]|nr:hypothetical protein [Trifolium medium]
SCTISGPRITLSPYVRATSPIGSENGLNMYFNPMIHGSIPTEGKNSIRKEGGEDREVAVPGPPKIGPWTVTERMNLDPKNRVRL